MAKRGRKPKSESAEKNVEIFTADKEGLLKVFENKERAEISPDVVAKFDIKPVSRIPMLSGKAIELFGGKDYEESLNNAYEWRDRKNREWKDKKIELVGYYPQVAFGKTVLVSYNIIPTKEAEAVA